MRLNLFEALDTAVESADHWKARAVRAEADLATAERLLATWRPVVEAAERWERAERGDYEETEHSLSKAVRSAMLAGATSAIAQAAAIRPAEQELESCETLDALRGVTILEDTVNRVATQIADWLDECWFRGSVAGPSKQIANMIRSGAWKEPKR